MSVPDESDPVVPEVAPRTDKPPPVTAVDLELVLGRLTDVEAPVTVVGRFEGVPLAGPIAEIDFHLENWIKRGYESGMLGTRLGEITFVPIDHLDPRPIRPERVLILGMGEAGRLSPDDLRFAVMNAVLAVKGLRLDGFSTALFTARRFGMRFDRAVRSVFDGIEDAYVRLRCVDTRTDQSQLLTPFKLTLVDPDRDRLQLIQERIKAIAKECPTLKLRMNYVEIGPQPATGRAPSAETEDSAFDTLPDVPTVRLTVSSTSDGDNGPAPAAAAGGVPGKPARLSFQCSAVTESAVIPVRQHELEPYFVDRITDRLINAGSPQEQEAYGLFLSSYLLNEEFPPAPRHRRPADPRSRLHHREVPLGDGGRQDQPPDALLRARPARHPPVPHAPLGDAGNPPSPES